MTSAAEVAAPRLMTAEEFFELPDDGMRHELIEGELHTMAPAGGRHGEIAVNVTGFVWQHVRQHQLGRCYIAETGFVLRRGPDTVRAPDLAFVGNDRLDGAASERFLEEVPDLVVEVVSPSDRASEVTRKALVWLDFGVRLVWVVYPRDRLVAVHEPGDAVGLVRGDDAVLDGRDVLPGFRVPLDDIFG